jgi:hypothetical protein
VNYVSLVNHDNLSMIWKYYFGLSHTWEAFKVLPHNFPFHICAQLKLMTFYMETLPTFQKKIEILVEKSTNLWSNSHWDIC